MLIVDDDADLSETLVRLLGRSGYKCLAAASGSEAVHLMDTITFDLVVTDLHMPGMDGLAVARCARQESPPIPVVLMTAYSTADTRRDAQLVGGIRYIAKPFATADMLDAVQRALDSGRVAPLQYAIASERRSRS